jgi:hypothetical protein
VKALEKFSTAELEGEIVRRKQGSSEWGYVVMTNDEDYDDKRPRFGIVNVKYWQKNEGLEDRCLGHDVRLPRGFHESQESQYTYSGTLKDGKTALDSAGFKYLGECDD